MTKSNVAARLSKVGEWREKPRQVLEFQAEARAKSQTISPEVDEGASKVEQLRDEEAASSSYIEHAARYVAASGR